MEKRAMNRLLILIALLIPLPLMADPLDRGEGYTTKSAPPQWMDSIDFGMLLVDYTLFAVILVALGWLFFKQTEKIERIERWLHRPFAAIFTAATRAGGFTEIVLQVIGAFMIFIALASWVFFCQWLKHFGLGALSMAGLGLMALLLVRAIKGGERRPHAHHGEKL